MKKDGKSNKTEITKTMKKNKSPAFRLDKENGYEEMGEKINILMCYYLYLDIALKYIK